MIVGSLLLVTLAIALAVYLKKRSWKRMRSNLCTIVVRDELLDSKKVQQEEQARKA